eukprot:maker-scaffold_1-snap-gene-13.38-mRNA-1 protein AED:0.01 eAED:0.01 QI:143/1/1/1/0/0/2/693/224
MLSNIRKLVTPSISSLRAFSTIPASLPDLSYDYGALEPQISGQIMELHHSKHHQTYITNYNVALEELDAAISSNETSKQIALQPAIKFNGGGHLNHTLFWENLCPAGSAEAEISNSPTLEGEIKKKYGSFGDFQTKFSTTAAAVQGSGWCWLAYDTSSDSVDIVTTANQDPCLATTGKVPLLGVDVWEHAYYLDYKNVRPDYLKAIFEVLNFKEAEKRLAAAKN